MARPREDFQEFYQASYGRTVAMVAAVAGSRHEAEDIAQEAYARALARWSRLRAYDLPEAWVRKVALRLAIDSGRRLRRGALASARLAARRDAPEPEPGDDLKYTALGAALLELPVRERQAVVLFYLADLPVDAIARECGLPAGTVKAGWPPGGAISSSASPSNPRRSPSERCRDSRALRAVGAAAAHSCAAPG
jgi:RNA polymerase sigma-70 factor, ECF subfamily